MKKSIAFVMFYWVAYFLYSVFAVVGIINSFLGLLDLFDDGNILLIQGGIILFVLIMCGHIWCLCLGFKRGRLHFQVLKIKLELKRKFKAMAVMKERKEME